MKTLLLIPSVLKSSSDADVAAGRHPTMDYYALAAGMRGIDGATTDLLDYAAVDADKSALVQFARKFGGRDAGLAMMGFLRRGRYDAIFTNGENVGIPLALLFHCVRRRPGHVTIGHRLSTGKKRLFFQLLKAHRQIDTIFVYAQTQLTFAREQLGIPAANLSLIPFHADNRFYTPQATSVTREDQICAAGLEWRDYPTLIEAVSEMPDLTVRLAAASPWSKHTDETAGRALPPNVDARRYEYSALRDLYAESAFVVVPLYENDFQAGVTTILEAMAMGKAVVITQTTGQTDVITSEENGLTVAPGDAAGWKQAILRLRQDKDLRERLGKNGRQWLEQNATLDRWVDHIITALGRSAGLDSSENYNQSQSALKRN